MNHDAIIGVLVSIICRHRRPAASLLQRLISLILYSGHASKRVQCDMIVMLHLSVCVIVTTLDLYPSSEDWTVPLLSTHNPTC